MRITSRRTGVDTVTGCAVVDMTGHVGRQQPQILVVVGSSES